MLKLTNNSKITAISTQEFNRKNLKKGKEIYKNVRQESKAVSFALQYGGVASTLVTNSGFTIEEANKILKNYKNLYQVSEKDKLDHIIQASKDGYVTGAFGLRIRTPCLGGSVIQTKVTPKEVESEQRSANNARFQSYCLLTQRAGVAFMEKVIKAGLQNSIKLINYIHDACYILATDDVDVIKFINDNLVKEFEWQKDPVIAHPQVKLGGELSIFWPNWSKELSLPNYISTDQIWQLVIEYNNKLYSH